MFDKNRYVASSSSEITRQQNIEIMQILEEHSLTAQELSFKLNISVQQSEKLLKNN